MARVVEIDYSKLTDSQMDFLYYYLDNEMLELKKICHIVWGNKGFPYAVYDDLYDDAMNVLVESVAKFDKLKNTEFKTYLVGNVKRSYIEWYRDNYLRSKRSNLELDENNNIKKDEDGHPIIIKNVSFDDFSKNEDDNYNLKEKISDKFTIETYFFEKSKEGYSEEMLKYLDRLSELQKQVLVLISIGFRKYEIIDELHITKKIYADCCLAIRSFKNIEILLRR